MQYPLIDRQLLAYLRLVHATYNTLVIALFFYHARLGIAIRRARRAHAPLPFQSIRRHRKGGPVLAGLGVLGFFIGFTLVMLDTGNVFEYAAHFLVGLTIALSIIATVFVSRRIQGPDSPSRTPHLILGIAILCFYLSEAFLGIGALL